MRIKKIWILISIIMLTSCSTGKNENYKYEYENRNGNGNGNGNGNEITISLPTAPSNSDIYKQIVWFDPGGGGYPGPIRNCKNCEVIGTFSSNIILQDFLPNQKLLLIFYFENGLSQCGNIGDFLSEEYVQVNSMGNLSINLEDKELGSFLYSIYDFDSNELQWQHRLLLGDPNCQN